MNNNDKTQGLGDAVATLPVIPTIDVVVFPHMVVPLLVLDEKIIKGINLALEGDKKVMLLAAKQQPSGYNGPIGVQDLYSVGTIGHIMRVMNLPEGGIKVLTQGYSRALVEEIITNKDILTVRAQEIPFDADESHRPEIERRVREIIQLTEKMNGTGKSFGPDFQVILSQINDPERIADFLISHLTLNIEHSQQLLEKSSIIELLDGIFFHLQSQMEISKVQERVRLNARESINKSQREYYLREQLKAIQKELGEESDSEFDELKAKVDTLPLTEEAQNEAKRQFRRLEKTSPDSLEATVIRNHLEWLLGLPWGQFSKDNVDIDHAKKVLDEEHFGLEEVKDRILDFLSVRRLKEDGHAPILCFAGPPGVGKTSLGRSIANCLQRSYFRIAVGGVHDESEIRGHRRTYVGALPGRFVQAFRKAGSMNPVIVIDEIDKIGASGRGDPSSALLEVLDPEQNATFYDNYLGVHIDLSKAMFIATANDLSTIPGPLRDRMEIIQLSGYTLEEKVEIAERHLIKKAIKGVGLENKGIEIGRDIVAEIINCYTREAGVRDLERNVQKLCSKFARAMVEGRQNVSFSPENLVEYLGPRKVSPEYLSNKNKVGVTNGLAWTPVGGEVLQVEAVLMPGNGKLMITGQAGDVMKESAQAAVSYARAHMDFFKINPKFFTEYDLHIHLPAGGIPKDGPSAGVTLLSSVLSALTNRPINSTFAMTGELNLQGTVLPIGGIKEKVLAAKQNGLKNVILPKLNQKDWVGMSDVEKDLNILWVESVEEVLDHVLMPADRKSVV